MTYDDIARRLNGHIATLTKIERGLRADGDTANAMRVSVQVKQLTEFRDDMRQAQADIDAAHDAADAHPSLWQ